MSLKENKIETVDLEVLVEEANDPDARKRSVASFTVRRMARLQFVTGAKSAFGQPAVKNSIAV